MTDDVVALIGEALKVLANPNRLRIALLLLEGERSVADIERELGIRQPTLSQQLGELREAHFVSTRREHKSVFYHVTEPRVMAVLNELCRIYAGAPNTLPAMRPSRADRSRTQQAAMFGMVGDRA
ncbi:winged helix-turn-helix transcriptional regulator [Methylobacterium sp. C25]|uniref:ArsR/SmtB family transcription factor n=1 Tax=Methylobacterium sp. C25 TaxID=2721622 RepID=UPI001F15E49D|nr:metalloregulator ArsR/SmtB family transcription factor [Methylobacterium sp. C25]MCE4226472.1 winged helix-turn-helix transcriptional regulator [Methylobacterium sp. C25]